MWKESGILKGQLFSTYGDTSLTGVDLNADGSGIVNGNHMFYGCTGLTSWNADLPNLTDGSYMFWGCTGLTSWTVELPNLTNGASMFPFCAKLISWNADLPNLTNGSTMFTSCTRLALWNGTLPNLTNGYAMFYNCSRLTSWNGTLPNLTNGSDMFYGCNLSAESVKLILNSIPDRASAGLAVANLNIGKRTNFKDDPDVKALLGETGTEITAKSYTIPPAPNKTL